MSKVIYTRGCGTLLHTTGIIKDVSFQNPAYNRAEKEQCFSNFIRLCQNHGIDASKIAVIGYDDYSNFVRIADSGDDNVFEKTLGNAIITNRRSVTLMDWAKDCCLVGLISFDGTVRSIIHASVKSLNAGIISKTIESFAEFDVPNNKIAAYIGACIGECCYEYGAATAYRDFLNFQDFIVPCTEYKVKINLYGAVKSALENSGVTYIQDIFSENHRCTTCARDEEGYIFPSCSVNSPYVMVFAS